ncbi:MAG TPA: galactokinase [Propioniciclava tarda]|nr:galactokinase [Propioniciclava tarda]
MHTITAWSDAEGAARAADLFRATFEAEPDGVWAAPGRVNLIGEHVDYNGGLCLPLALPHSTFAAVRRRDDDVVRLVSSLDPEAVWEDPVSSIAPGAVSSWAAYAAGPAWALREAGCAVGGFEAAIDSCVPLGAGLSSSAAIECAVALALDELFGCGYAARGDAGRAALASICVKAENEVAGAPTGGMDQATSLRGASGHALLLDCRDSTTRLLPFDLAAAGLELLVIDTRAAHALGDGQYGRRRAACEAAAARLGVQTLREVTDLDAALTALADDWERRCVRHVVTEIERVKAVARLLDADRPDAIGALLDASHDSLRDDYAVSCPELDAAVDAARAAGALGARMTGGGFGGSAIALIRAGDEAAVARGVQAAFDARGWTRPAFLSAVPGPGARRVR